MHIDYEWTSAFPYWYRTNIPSLSVTAVTADAFPMSVTWYLALLQSRHPVGAGVSDRSLPDMPLQVTGTHAL